MAAFLMTVPELSGDFTPAQQKQISGAFSTLSEQLKYLLCNLEADNFSTGTQELIAKTKATADSAAALASSLQQGVTNASKDLYNKIVASANEISQSYAVALATTVDSITSSVAENYTAKSDTAALSQLLSSFVEQTSRDITFSFNEANAYTVGVGDALQAFIDEIDRYYMG